MSQWRRQRFLCFLQGDAEGSPWEKQLAEEQQGQSRDASSKLQMRERARRQLLTEAGEAIIARNNI